MKNNITLRHTHVRGILRVILVLLISFFYCNVTNAQSSFTPVDYDLPDVPSQNSNGYTNYLPNTTLNSNTHNKQSINFICSESNGFGTWAADDAGHWYLLGNTLNDEDPTNASGAVPSGIVASGSFPPSPDGATIPYSFSSHVKVTANLNGNVRYVWWQSGGAAGFPVRFVVQGFNSVSQMADPASQIDISIPTGYPNSSGSLDIIKGVEDPSNNSFKIHDYGTYVPFSNGLFSTIPPDGPSGEVDNHWKDNYDISCDEKYLYITWQMAEFKYKVLNGPEVFEYHIFAVVLNLLDNTPVSGFNWPIQVNSIGTHGVRPTVACNRRNNKLNDNITDAPDFDLAYISCANGITPMGISNSVMHVHITNQALINNQWARTPLDKRFHVDDTQPDSQLPTYGSPRRVRMLVASVKESAIPCKGVYVIVDPVGTHLEYANDLILHKFSASTNTNPPIDEGLGHISAKIADGNQFNSAGAHTSALFSPEDANIPYWVINLPIIAFTNPYDGINNVTFNEFHCLYQVHRQAVSETDPINPSRLMLIRGTDNGKVTSVYNINGIKSGDTRTLLCRKKVSDTWILLDPPFTNFNSQFFSPNYTGSVNQMGIHVYWRGGEGKVFYSRDKRTFDEDIEENTLVTNDCYVGDLRSYPVFKGATLLPGKTMTLWTDPHFNNGALFGRSPSSPDNWQNATLTIAHYLTPLIIGDNDANDIHLDNTAHAGSTLNFCPNFEVHYNGVFFSGIISVDPSSVLNYYGVPYNYSTNPEPSALPNNFFGSICINILGGPNISITTGTIGQYPNSPLDHPAILNIHGGSEFFIPDGSALICWNSTVNFLVEPSIFPLIPNSSTNTNPKNGGFINAFGNVDFNSSILQNTSSPQDVAGKVLRAVSGKDGWLNIDKCEVKALNCRLEIGYNSDVTPIPSTPANRKVLTEDNGSHTKPFSTPSELSVFVTQSLFSKANLYIANPGADSYCRIEGASFNLVPNFGLYLFRDNTSDYSDIHISGCQFNGGGTRLVSEGFNKALQTIGNYNRISISDNNFIGGGTAIHSINSNIAAYGNKIDGYQIGIQQTQSGASGLDPNTSFFCNNRITNCLNNGAGRGMLLDNWSGYIKLTRISSSDVGAEFGDNSNGGLFFSYIHSCNKQGILIQGTSSSKLDMSGVHGGGNDYEAWDTIEMNNSSTSGINHTGQIELNDNGRLRIGNLSGYSNYGHNNLKGRGDNNNVLDNLIYHSGNALTIGFHNNSSDDKLDKNYWEDANGTLGTSTNISNLISDQYPFKGISFSTIASDNRTSYYQITGVSCSSGTDEIIKGKGNPQPQSFESLDTNLCQHLSYVAEYWKGGGQYQKAYDTAKAYIEHCALFSTSWETFLDIDGYNGQRSDDLHRHEEYREWLKKVLYLNVDTAYYCADVSSIIKTFSWFNDIRGRDHRGTLAVLYFLSKNNRCPKLTAYIDSVNIPATWNALYQRWYDSVSDPVKTPFDSTLPTLEDLDLGILRGQPEDVKKYFDSKYSEVLSNIIATVNPFSSETKIEFRCREASAIHFEVYDILGKKVYDGGNRVYDEGENRIFLPGKDLPHGELFGRFSASDGTVKTIKLQHF